MPVPASQSYQPHKETYNNNASLLHFITCGSVDDGKSTLIGRLLHDTGAIPEDQTESFKRESRKFNSADNAPDFALLVDGLSAEREQGITIDVAYRYFSTQRRFFIIADTPGHEQYTRNMATGASQADLAILLIDARKGVLPQTRRHSFITSMVGIRTVVIAINKMDLVNFDQTVFDRIVREYKSLLPKLDFHKTIFIPLSARLGINVVKRGNRIPWYTGPTLFEYLEKVEPSSPDREAESFCLPVQSVNRFNHDFRGICGTVAGGRISVGDVVCSLPGGEKNRIKKIYNPSGLTDSATAGEAIMLTFETEIDTARGDVIVSENNRMIPSKTVRSQVLWMSTHPMIPGKRYFLKLATSLIPVTISQLEEKTDIHTYCSEAAKNLGINEIGHIILHLEQPLIAKPYNESRILGSFILIDPANHETVALGIIRNTFASPLIKQKKQGRKPVISWFEKLRCGYNSTKKTEQILLSRLVCGIILAALAFASGASFTGACGIFILDIIFCPLLNILLFSSGKSG